MEIGTDALKETTGSTLDRIFIRFNRVKKSRGFTRAEMKRIAEILDALGMRIKDAAAKNATDPDKIKDAWDRLMRARRLLSRNYPSCEYRGPN